jgi:hypothetical protein
VIALERALVGQQQVQPGQRRRGSGHEQNYSAI